jgi:hypothetical protein
MKRKQRAHLDSMGKKCDTMRRRDNVGHMRGGTGRRKKVDDASWTNVNLAGSKNEENLRDQFNYYKMNGKDLKQRGVNLFF